MAEDTDCYSDDSIQIHGEVFDKDFDDVSWDPIEEDDSDSDAADMFGYND